LRGAQEQLGDDFGPGLEDSPHRVIGRDVGFYVGFSHLEVFFQFRSGFDAFEKLDKIFARLLLLPFLALNGF
jgi:hypothetical protein